MSNENPEYVEVYFDDFKVTQTKTNILQYNEYYPFGLQASTSWTRDNNSNNFLYNGPTESNATTGLIETMFRSYDPALGRFMQVDPLAYQTIDETPYHFANNNPIKFNDPTGLFGAMSVGTAAFIGAGMSEVNQTGYSAMGEITGFFGNIPGNASGEDIDGDGQLDSPCSGCTIKQDTYVKNGVTYTRTWQQGPEGMRLISDTYDAFLMALPNVSSLVVVKDLRQGNAPFDWFGFVGEIFEKNYNGGVVYDGNGLYNSNFLGPSDPIDPYKIPDPNHKGEYLKPKDMIDASGQRHDYFYYLSHADGVSGVVFNGTVTIADQMLAYEAAQAFFGYFRGDIDPVTTNPISPRTRDMALDIMIVFGVVGSVK